MTYEAAILNTELYFTTWLLHHIFAVKLTNWSHNVIGYKDI